jgi:uracil-DNA glycosylase
MKSKSIIKRVDSSSPLAVVVFAQRLMGTVHPRMQNKSWNKTTKWQEEVTFLKY